MKSALTTAETWHLTSIAWPFNPSVAADSWCYFILNAHACVFVGQCFSVLPKNAQFTGIWASHPVGLMKVRRPYTKG